jgi:hypothetical protein
MYHWRFRRNLLTPGFGRKVNDIKAPHISCGAFFVQGDKEFFPGGTPERKQPRWRCNIRKGFSGAWDEGVGASPAGDYMVAPKLAS